MPSQRSHFHPRPWQLVYRMVVHGSALVPLALGALALGMAIYHWVEGLGWADSFLNAAMLLGGMGPVAPLQTTAGKWLAGLYALFAGMVFLVVAGVMLAPMVHSILHRFHLETDDPDAPR
ncbi:MAG TPA: hypothetical protein VJS92_18305 [Candidatus Polarisedimenticolaceae bacterium]|nr:hypothetical protein [Candidatus Polarisedimenticolaceae bacterium]